MPNAIHGSCLCGSVKFEIAGKYSPAGQCHCSKCRKVSGTDGNAVFLASYEGLRWLGGEENAKTYVVPGSTWKSRFCGTCGSPLPFPDNRKQIYFVPAGLLDDDPGFRGFRQHIFVGSKAPWVVISDGAPQFEFDAPRFERTNSTS